MADETAMPEAETATSAPTEAAPDAAIAAAKAEAADMKDKLLRTLAEMENLRRRTERDVTDARQYAVSNFARDMLTVADNLQRAIAAVPADARSADPALANLMEGVEATGRQLEQSLARAGIKEIRPAGQKFDPAFHQAIFEKETPDVAPGMVADVVQSGYTIGDRVLRPAMVAVAKAPKAAAPAPADDDAPAESG